MSIILSSYNRKKKSFTEYSIEDIGSINLKKVTQVQGDFNDFTPATKAECEEVAVELGFSNPTATVLKSKTGADLYLHCRRNGGLEFESVLSVLKARVKE